MWNQQDVLICNCELETHLSHTHTDTDTHRQSKQASMDTKHLKQPSHEHVMIVQSSLCFSHHVICELSVNTHSAHISST